MTTKAVLIVAAAAASMLSSQIAFSQDTSPPSPPVSRAAIKADTKAAEKARQLTPAGEGLPGDKQTSFKSTKTRSERKAETLVARRQGALEPTGEAAGLKEERAEDRAPSTVSRAQRKAQTRALEKAGKLTPAGEGPDAPRK